MSILPQIAKMFIIMFLLLSGTLYVLAEHTNKQRSLLVIHNWSVVRDLWIAVARILPSEKPSIIQLLSAISTLLYRTIETTSVHSTFTEECIKSAQVFSEANLGDEELKKAAQKDLEWGQKNEELYYELLDSLVGLLTSGTLHWRMYNLAFNMLCLQLRADLPAPPEVIRIFVQNLLHDAIAVRKIAIKGVGAILKQQKRKHKKIVIDPIDIARKFSPPHIEERTKWYSILLNCLKSHPIELLRCSVIVDLEISGKTAGCNIKEKSDL